MTIHAFIGPDREWVFDPFIMPGSHYYDAMFNVYPSEVKKVVDELRASGDDIVIHTNNPLVINELQPDEVTLVTIHDGVVRKTLMRDTKNFKERASVYALGELWLSFCTGALDEPNLTGSDDDGSSDL